MEFTEKYLKFIHKEFGIDNESAVALTDDQLDDLYDKVCDIEVEEAKSANDGDGVLSKRGQVATELVDYIWTSQNGAYPENTEDGEQDD